MSADEKKPEPEWIGRLSRMAAASSRMERTPEGGTFGAASKGKRLIAWSCSCGWNGSSRDLKAGPDGLACPICGGEVRPR